MQAQIQFTANTHKSLTPHVRGLHRSAVRTHTHNRKIRAVRRGPPLHTVQAADSSRMALHTDTQPAPLDPHADNTVQDVGNIISFEHVNLEVPDLEAARLFFSEGLGLPMDPSRTGAQRGGVNVLWFNIGKAQFHICKGSVAQTLPSPGSVIGLVLPDIGAVAKQLEQKELQELGVTIHNYHPGQDTLEVTDPHGQLYRVHSKSQFPSFAADRGIVYLQLPCFVGTSASIGRFYAEKMGARVCLPQPNTQPVPQCTVHLGHPGTELVFQEREELGSLSDEAVLRLYSGWHIAFYIAQFSATYDKLRSYLFTSHPYSDKVYNFNDALKYHQYRFQDICKPPSEEDAASDRGQLLYRISHEVRSTGHPNFLRNLYNR